MKLPKQNCKRCGEEVYFIAPKPTFNKPETQPVEIDTIPNDEGNLSISNISQTFTLIPKRDIDKAKVLGLKFYSYHSRTCKKRKR